MASKYSPLNASRASDYSGLASYLQPQENPMFSQGQGYIPYMPEVPQVVPDVFANGADFRAFERAQMPQTNSLFDQSQSFGGNWMDALKGYGSKALDSVGGRDFWFGGTDKATGNKTNGAADTVLGLLGAFNSYGQGKNMLKAYKENTANQQNAFRMNFNNAADTVDDRRRANYERDVAEAKLNNRAGPKEFKPLARA